MPSFAATGAVSPEERALALVHLGNQAEIKDARLARDAAVAHAVKQYAIMLENDHTAADARVSALVSALGLSLLTPAALGSEGTQMVANHNAAFAQLATHHGAAFDRAFLEHEVSDHEIVLAKIDQLLTVVSPGSKVGGFLDGLRPKLQHHLDEANALLARMD
jgi:putative membrane protein